MPQYSISAAQIIVYLNEKKFTTTQAVNFSIDYGEQEIMGIDSLFPQEIASTRVTVTGNLQGLRLRNSGGIQAMNGRPLLVDILSAPYVSIRIQDRLSQEDIIFIPKAKISNESHSVSAKGIYKINFTFKGMLPLMALDRS